MFDQCTIYRLFAFFTVPIIHLVYPPKFLYKNCSILSWDACKSQEKLKTMYYGIMKTVNTFKTVLDLRQNDSLVIILDTSSLAF